MPWKLEDLTGQKFNHLTAIRHVGRFNNKTIWLWKCDCGKEKEIFSSNVKRNMVKSCGCLTGELIRKSKLKPEGVSTINKAFAGYRLSARNRGYSFELNKEEFKYLIFGDCFYCGQPPSSFSTGKGYNGGIFRNGIDRVDNTKGYTIENCVSCCRKCNSAKLEQTLPEFLDWISAIYNYTYRPYIKPFTITVVKA